jgi:hypothetical protein
MVTDARRRVLRAYRRQREQGAPPLEAILLVRAYSVNAVHCADTNRAKAVFEWDAFYADRYYKIICVKGKDQRFWARGLMVRD